MLSSVVEMLLFVMCIVSVLLMLVLISMCCCLDNVLRLLVGSSDGSCGVSCVVVL